MKASELIKDLERLKKKHGDQNVYFLKENDTTYYPVRHCDLQEVSFLFGEVQREVIVLFEGGE